MKNLKATDFSDVTNLMRVLSEEVPDRTTLGQISFFLFAAMADLRGKASTFTEIKDEVGPSVGRSLHTTYQLFLDRPLRRSDYSTNRQGLGWLTRELDQEDNRRNYLRLTPRGKEILVRARNRGSIK